MRHVLKGLAYSHARGVLPLVREQRNLRHQYTTLSCFDAHPWQVRSSVMWWGGNFSLQYRHVRSFLAYASLAAAIRAGSADSSTLDSATRFQRVLDFTGVYGVTQSTLGSRSSTASGVTSTT